MALEIVLLQLHLLLLVFCCCSNVTSFVPLYLKCGLRFLVSSLMHVQLVYGQRSTNYSISTCGDGNLFLDSNFS